MSSDPKGATLGKSRHTLDELHAYPAALTAKIFNHVHIAVPGERHGVGPTRPEPTLTPLRI